MKFNNKIFLQPYEPTISYNQAMLLLTREK